MCGRFTAVDVREIYIKYGLGDLVPYLEPSYNVAPSHEIPAITNTSNSKDKRITMLKWGLIPSWAKDQSMAYKMINARAETVDERPSFRNLLKSKRCLIPADGFYEWKREEKNKIPYRFILRSGQVFAFAGLWDSWFNPNGDLINTFTIITTTPNSLLEPVHNRMPVILTEENEKLWLDPKFQDKHLLKELLKPYPSELMEKYQVSDIVNSPKNNDERCIQRISL
ncbi:MAG: SOS response-associated peptidase [Clostridiales bacterium]|nr:SOS response-associated peptidase [Clostridiales bacterium]